MKDLNPRNSVTTLRRVRNPSAPSSEEVWQSLRDYRAGIPERLARWKQASLASQEPLAQVEQHESSSRDTVRDRGNRLHHETPRISGVRLDTHGDRPRLFQSNNFHTLCGGDIGRRDGDPIR